MGTLGTRTPGRSPWGEGPTPPVAAEEETEKKAAQTPTAPPAPASTVARAPVQTPLTLGRTGTRCSAF